MGRGREGREIGGMTRLGYLSPEFLVTPLHLLHKTVLREGKKVLKWNEFVKQLGYKP